jgi:hypothetical protein
MIIAQGSISMFKENKVSGSRISFWVKQFYHKENCLRPKSPFGGRGKNKSPRLSRSGELFLSLTKQNYLK